MIFTYIKKIILVNIYFSIVIISTNLYAQIPKNLIIKIDSLSFNKIITSGEIDFSKIQPNISLDLARTDYARKNPSTSDIFPQKDYEKIYTGPYCQYGKKSNGRWEVLSLSGNQVFTNDFLDIFHIGKGKFLARNDNDMFGVIDSNDFGKSTLKNKIVIPYQYKFIDYSKSNYNILIGFMSDGIKHILNLEGKILYEGVFTFEEDFIKQNGYYGLITSNFIMVPCFTEINTIKPMDIFSFKYKNKNGLISSKRAIYPLNFEYCTVQNDNIISFGNGIKIIFDKNLNQLFDSKISEYIDNSDHTYFIKKNKMWQWVDSIGVPFGNLNIKDKPKLFRHSSIYKNIYYYTHEGENFYFNTSNTLPKINGYSDVQLIGSLPFYCAKKVNNFDILNRFFKKIKSINCESIAPYNKIFLFKAMNKYIQMDTLGNETEFNSKINYVDSTNLNNSDILNFGSLKYYKSGNKYGLKYNLKWTEAFIDYILNPGLTSSSFIYDKMFFKSDGLNGFLTKDTLMYPTIYSSFIDQNGLIRANKLNNFDILDLKGNILMSDLKMDYQIQNYGIKNGKPIFYKQDQNGNFKIKENLLFIKKLPNGNVIEINNRLGILNEDLELIIQPKYINIEYLRYKLEGFFIVTKDNKKYGLFDSKGVEILKPVYDAIYSNYPEIIVIKNGKNQNFDHLIKLSKYGSIFIK